MLFLTTQCKMYDCCVSMTFGSIVRGSSHFASKTAWKTRPLFGSCHMTCGACTAFWKLKYSQLCVVPLHLEKKEHFAHYLSMIAAHLHLTITYLRMQKTQNVNDHLWGWFTTTFPVFHHIEIKDILHLLFNCFMFLLDYFLMYLLKCVWFRVKLVEGYIRC